MDGIDGPSPQLTEELTPGPATTDKGPTTAQVARAIWWRALNVIIGQGVWYASLLVLAILVSPRDFGAIAVGVVVINVMLLLLESGTSGALIIARELDARSVRTAVIRTGAAGIGLALLFVVLAEPIANTFAPGSDPNAMRALAPIVALIGAWIVPQALLMKYLRFKQLAIVRVAAAVVGSTVAITAAALGAGLWALVLRLALYQLVLTVLGWAAAANLLSRLPREAAQPGRPRGAGAFLAIALAALLAWEGDILIVGASTDTTQLGLYALAFSLGFLPLTQVSWPIGSVLLPAVALARDPDVIRRQSLKALRLMTLVLLPLLPAAVVLAPGLIPGLLGEKWSGAVVPFQILVAVGVGLGILNALAEVFSGAGDESLRGRARIDVVWAIATLAAIAVGVQSGGIRGAAAAHGITCLGLALAYSWLAVRTIGVPFRSVVGELRGIGACVFVQALLSVAVALAVESAGGSSLAAGLLGAGVGAMGLVLALYVREHDLLVESRAVVSAAVRKQPALSDDRAF